MLYNKLLKYTETPEIMDIQEALGVPETGVMDEQTLSTLTMQIQESGFAESKYFLEKIEDEQPENPDTFLIEVAAEAILKEHYKCEMEKIAKFMQECYDDKIKEQGVEVIEMEYDPEHHGSKEYQSVFEKGGRIYKKDNKQYLRYQEGGTAKVTGSQLFAKSGLGPDKERKFRRQYLKGYKGNLDDVSFTLNRDETGNVTFTPDQGGQVYGQLEGSNVATRTPNLLTGQREGKFSRLLANAASNLEYTPTFTKVETEEPVKETTYKTVDYNGTLLEIDENGISKDGILRYFGDKWYKLVDGKWVAVDGSTPDANEPDPNKQPQGGVNNRSISAPENINTSEFQQFVRDVEQDEAILGNFGDRGVDNKWGANTQNAWNKYGEAFKNLLKAEKHPIVKDPSEYTKMSDTSINKVETTSTPITDFNTTDLEKYIKQLQEKRIELKNKIDLPNLSSGYFASFPLKSKDASSYQPVYEQLNKVLADNEVRMKKIREQKSEAEKQKYLAELKALLTPNKKQGGTIFSKFKKGGTIEISEKSLESALKNVVGSGLKKKEFTLDKSPVFSSSTLIEDEQVLVEALCDTDSIKEADNIKASFVAKYPYITAEYFENIDEKVAEKQGKEIDNTRISNLDGKPIYHSSGSDKETQMRKMKQGGTMFKKYQKAGMFNNPLESGLGSMQVKLTGPNGEIVYADKGSAIYNSYVGQGYTENTPSSNNVITTQGQNNVITPIKNIFEKNATSIGQGLVGMDGQPLPDPSTQTSASQLGGIKQANLNQKLGNDFGLFDNTLKTSRANSAKDLMSTALDAFIAKRNSVNFRPIDRVFKPDVQTRLMTDRSPIARQVQQQFARNVQGANRFANPEMQTMMGMNMLEQQAKFGLDQSAAEIQDKYNNRDVQFTQGQQRDQAIKQGEADIDQQQQELNARNKQAKAAMERDLAQAGLNYVVGGSDNNEQAVRMDVYNRCLDRNTRSPESKGVIEKMTALNKELALLDKKQTKTAEDTARVEAITAEQDQLRDKYTEVSRTVESCFNDNIATAMSQQAGLGSFGVKKTNVDIKKNGGFFRSFAKGGKNVDLQDYYKTTNKDQGKSNKQLSDAIKNIIK
jgi:hypothetical protein